MRILLVILHALVFIPIFISANMERKLAPDYAIISDKPDSSVPQGYCKVIGTVMFGGEPIYGVRISGFKSESTVLTDKKGKFEILVDTSERALYTTYKNKLPAYFENYQFKSSHQIEMIFYLKNPESIYNPAEVKKPVIYAYSPQNIQFEIQLKTEATITFSYPKLVDKWEFQINETGQITDSLNQTFPYLFWEGAIKNLNFQRCNEKIAGTFLNKSEIVSFLEGKLKALGFNSKEQTDFITFWAPELMKYPTVFVQLLIDEEYEVISTMKIIPKPENIKRVYLLFSDGSKISSEFINVDIPLKPLNRSGFTIVEWGGTEIFLNPDL